MRSPRPRSTVSSISTSVVPTAAVVVVVVAVTVVVAAVVVVVVVVVVGVAVVVVVVEVVVVVVVIVVVVVVVVVDVPCFVFRLHRPAVPGIVDELFKPARIILHQHLSLAGSMICCLFDYSTSSGFAKARAKLTKSRV